MDQSIINHNFNIIKNYDNSIKLNNYDNELIQVILNIFNNSSDALKQNIENIDERYIFIDTFIEKDNAIITFCDSAGGISNDIIDKIFEPYFTTKHQSQGTGLGLYMCHQIIMDSMGGDLSVKNEIIKFNGKDYIGAKFRIKIPL